MAESSKKSSKDKDKKSSNDEDPFEASILKYKQTICKKYFT